MTASPLDKGVMAYPNAAIDPRKKDYQWILQYVRAAYNDGRGYLSFNPINVNGVGTLKFSEIKLYNLAQQPVDKYKKQFSPGNPTDEGWRAIDWNPPGFYLKFRDIGVSKIVQRRHDIQAFVVDPLAKSQEDEYFNRMKVKIMMRQAALQAGSDLADSPQLQPQPGEPEDMEQLTIQREFGYKHVMAMEAEKGVDLIHQQNDFEELRKRCCANLYDFGIAGYTEWIDENGMVKIREVDPEYLGLSYCEKPDFSDLVHWFEIVPTYVADLAPYYTKEQLDKICEQTIGQNGNPTAYTPFNGYFNTSWYRFKVFVLQIKFLSWNETIYKEEVDGRGNTRFGKTDFANKRFLSINGQGNLEGEISEYEASMSETGTDGSATPKYMNEVKKVVYEASWVMGTDYMHNYGIQKNQNRKLSSWWDTDLGIQLYAWNFYKMRFTGVTQRLIPLEDKACMTWFNLQNLSNKLIPYLINIDFNAVEAVNFGKGGKKAQPSEIIDFIFSNFVVPYRSTDLLSRNPNYKPVSVEATGQLAAFGQLYEELQHTIEMMRQVSGLNEITDGSTPNERNLNSTNEAAIQSTNNALYLISLADKNLIQRSADAIVQKIQIAVKLGKVEGYAKAIGKNAVEFFSINPDIALHELGIFLEDSPTDQQREQLWMEVSSKETQGLLTVADKMMIMKCRNLTEAGMLLNYKIEKRKEQAHAQQMELVQQQTESNAQVAQVSEQMKQQTISMQGEIDMQLLIVGKQLEMEIERMKKSADLQGEMAQAEGRINVGEIAAQAKIISQQIAANAQKESKHIDATSNLLGKKIASDGAKEKQEIANRKPKTTTSKK